MRPLPKKRRISQIRLDTGGGHGSSSTMIRRFANITSQRGIDITYVDSSTLGCVITINATGVYAINYVDLASTTINFGLSLNSTELTTAITGITIASRLATSLNVSGQRGHVGYTGFFQAGDIIRPHTDAGGTPSTGATVCFSIVRVA